MKYKPTGELVVTRTDPQGFHREKAIPAAEMMLAWASREIDVDFRDRGSNDAWLPINDGCSWDWGQYEYRKRPEQPIGVTMWCVMWMNGRDQNRSFHQTEPLACAYAKEREDRGFKPHIIELTGVYQP